MGKYYGEHKNILKNKLDVSYIIDLIPNVFGDTLQEHEKYQSIYGRDTCVLMQCGHFFEVYAVDNDEEKINAEGIPVIRYYEYSAYS